MPVKQTCVLLFDNILTHATVRRQVSSLKRHSDTSQVKKTVTEEIDGVVEEEVTSTTLHAESRNERRVP